MKRIQFIALPLSFSPYIYIVFCTGITNTLEERIIALSVTVFILYPISVGDDRLFPVIEGVVTLGVFESEEIVVLTADTGTEGAGF